MEVIVVVVVVVVATVVVASQSGTVAVNQPRAREAVDGQLASSVTSLATEKRSVRSARPG